MIKQFPIDPTYNYEIVDGAVTTNKIADQSVTESKIADGAVSTSKIANNAVATAKILDKNVTADKIADKTITKDQIADKTLTDSQMADGSVTTSIIANGSITNAKLYNGGGSGSGINADKVDSIEAVALSRGRIYRLPIINSSGTTSSTSTGWFFMFSYYNSCIWFDPSEWNPPTGTLQIRAYGWSYDSSSNNGQIGVGFSQVSKTSTPSGAGSILTSAYVPTTGYTEVTTPWVNAPSSAGYLQFLFYQSSSYTLYTAYNIGFEFRVI